MTAVARVTVDGNEIHAIDSVSGKDLLELVQVESLTLDLSAGDRRLTLEISPWAFMYDVVNVKTAWTYKGELIRGIVIGDDVASTMVPIADVLKEFLNGK